MDRLEVATSPVTQWAAIIRRAEFLAWIKGTSYMDTMNLIRIAFNHGNR